MAPSRKADPASLTPVGRRGHYRHQVQSLAYVSLDQSNGGIIRNLGDSGLAIQAVAPLHLNQHVFLRFELANPRVRVEATGRVAWADPAGQAGIEFSTLSQRSERLLKDWILFSSSPRPNTRRGMRHCSVARAAREAAELLFSSGARPAIRLKPAPPAALEEIAKPPRLLHLALVSIRNFSARPCAAGGWSDRALGGAAFCIDLHGHGRRRPRLTRWLWR